MTRDVHCLMRSGSGGVPTRQRGAPKRPAVLGWVIAAHSDFLRFAVEPIIFPLSSGFYHFVHYGILQNQFGTIQFSPGESTIFTFILAGTTVPSICDTSNDFTCFKFLPATIPEFVTLTTTSFLWEIQILFT